MNKNNANYDELKEGRDLIFSLILRGEEKILLSLLKRFSYDEENLQKLIKIAEEEGLEIIF